MAILAVILAGIIVVIIFGVVLFYRIMGLKKRVNELKPFFDFLIEDYKIKIQKKIQKERQKCYIVSVESFPWDLDAVVKEFYPEIPSFDKLHERPYTLSISDLIKKVNWTIDPQDLILKIKEV